MWWRLDWEISESLLGTIYKSNLGGLPDEFGWMEIFMDINHSLNRGKLGPVLSILQVHEGPCRNYQISKEK